jgi:rare lipoprotein A
VILLFSEAFRTFAPHQQDGLSMKLILTIALFIGCFTAASSQSVRNAATDMKKGIASFYHKKFEGRRTATGDVFDNSNYTAASNHIRLNSFVKVTNLQNGRIIYVKVNDRMAAGSGRVCDLTQLAAEKLGYKSAGTAQVKMEIVTEEEGRRGVLAQRDLKPDATRNKL